MKMFKGKQQLVRGEVKSSSSFVARGAVFLSQFAWVRSTHRRLMSVVRYINFTLPKRASGLFVKKAKYPGAQAFPLSLAQAKLVASALTDTKFQLARYGLSGEELSLSPLNEIADPNEYFDTDWYLDQLRNLNLATNLPPFIHYLMHGRKMSLDASPLFRNEDYLRENPDLAKTKMNLLYHFLVFGIAENRIVSNVERENIKRLSRPIEPASPQGRIAILIPAFNNWLWTERAIRSVLRNTHEGHIDIYVVDDFSSDETSSQLKMVYPQVKVLRNSSNLGFLNSCNRAFKIISETNVEFIYLLNNDAEVQPTFLDEPLRLMLEDESVGLVGSKLIYQNGVLQEAGGIIWSDGSGRNFGRNHDSHHFEYNFVRQADYLSGAALLIRVEALKRVNYFDVRFLPAYYEDTDLAFEFRELGYKTLYCPDSVVVHHEGKSHGVELNSGVKQSQVLNQTKFRNKWSSSLDSHFQRNLLKVSQASMRLELESGSKTILWIDYKLPDPTRDSGSVRAIELLKIARKLGHFIVFVPANGDVRTLDSFWAERHGIVVIPKLSTAIKFLKKIERTPDILWLSRLEVCQQYFDGLVRLFPKAKTVFDTVDLHFIRVARELNYYSNSPLRMLSGRLKKYELGYISKADLAVVVSETEKTLLEREHNQKNIKLVSNVHLVDEDTSTSRVDRQGIVFVGGFKHRPNESGVLWFHENVWPLLPPIIRAEGLVIVGQNPSKEIRALAADDIKVLGWVPSSSSYVSRAKVSIAPLLIGAGVKGKIGEAIMLRTPVVTTSIGAEGMGLENFKTSIIADEPIDFAEGIVKLFSDPEMAIQMAENAVNLLQATFSPSSALVAMRDVLELDEKTYSEENTL